jgi:hypothetical protein
MKDPERPENTDAPPAADEESLGEFDHLDPLKRDPDDDAVPGLDPIVPPIPPES